MGTHPTNTYIKTRIHIRNLVSLGIEYYSRLILRFHKKQSTGNSYTHPQKICPTTKTPYPKSSQQSYRPQQPAHRTTSEMTMTYNRPPILINRSFPAKSLLLSCSL